MSETAKVAHAIRHLSFTVEDKSTDERRAALVGQGIDTLLIEENEWAELRAQIDRVLGFSQAGVA